MKIVIEAGRTFVKGVPAVDKFKRQVMDLVNSGKYGLAFGRLSEAAQKYENPDEIPFPLYLKGGSCVPEIWDELGLDGEMIGDNGLYKAVKKIQDESGNDYKFPVNIWNESEIEFGGSGM